jgi:tripeptidyl-peptidase-1
VQRANPSDLLNLIFAIKQTNLPELERTVLAVSDPRSPRYGQHLSMDAVNKLVAPAPESTKAVLSFLLAHGVPASDVSVVEHLVPLVQI